MQVGAQAVQVAAQNPVHPAAPETGGKDQMPHGDCVRLNCGV